MLPGYRRAYEASVREVREDQLLNPMFAFVALRGFTWPAHPQIPGSRPVEVASGDVVGYVARTRGVPNHRFLNYTAQADGRPSPEVELDASPDSLVFISSNLTLSKEHSPKPPERVPSLPSAVTYY